MNRFRSKGILKILSKACLLSACVQRFDPSSTAKVNFHSGSRTRILRRILFQGKSVEFCELHSGNMSIWCQAKHCNVSYLRCSAIFYFFMRTLFFLQSIFSFLHRACITDAGHGSGAAHCLSKFICHSFMSSAIVSSFEKCVPFSALCHVRSRTECFVAILVLLLFLQ